MWKAIFTRLLSVVTFPKIFWGGLVIFFTGLKKKNYNLAFGGGEEEGGGRFRAGEEFIFPFVLPEPFFFFLSPSQAFFLSFGR
jgi:hypothetical protein